MQLLTNEIEPDAVRRHVEDGTEYLTAPVVMAKAMPLNGGYLPQSEIEASAQKWNGIDVPIGHPTKNGQAVSVDSDHDHPVIGEIRNAKAEGERLLGELWLNIQQAKQAGTEGVQVLSRLASGEPLEVSTAYVPNTVEENAEADGKTRQKVVRDIDPDHLAVLPNEKGKCSVSDGCGAPRVNQLLVPMTDDGDTPEDMATADTMHRNKQVDGITFTGIQSGKLDESEIPNDDYASHYVFDGETKTESSYPLVDADGNLRRGNVESAYQLYGRAPDPEKLLSVLAEVNDEFDTPPIDPDDLEESMSNNADSQSGAVEWLLNFLGMDSSETTGAESLADSKRDMERDTMIEALATNTALKRESLEGLGDNCLQNVYQHRLTENEDLRANAEIDWNGLLEVVADALNASTGEVADALGNLVPEGEQNMAQNESSDGDETVELAKNELEEIVDEKVNEILAANEQSELVDEILANTDEYDRETLEQTPEAVLEEIHDNVTRAPAAGMPANTGRKSVNTEESYGGPTDFGEYLNVEGE